MASSESSPYMARLQTERAYNMSTTPTTVNLKPFNAVDHPRNSEHFGTAAFWFPPLQLPLRRLSSPAKGLHQMANTVGLCKAKDDERWQKWQKKCKSILQSKTHGTAGITWEEPPGWSQIAGSERRGWRWNTKGTIVTGSGVKAAGWQPAKKLSKYFVWARL